MQYTYLSFTFPLFIIYFVQYAYLFIYVSFTFSHFNYDYDTGDLKSV